MGDFRESVERVLAESPGLSASEIADKLGYTGSVRVLGKQLTALGLRKVKRSDNHRYYLPAVPAKVSSSREKRKATRHGLTKAEKDLILESQGGRCRICRTDDPGGKDWCTDHDHRHCDRPQGCRVCVRGLLCSNCNSGLGFLKDSVLVVRRALQYLEETQSEVYSRMIRDAEEYRKSLESVRDS